ncbi:hypothetical protein AC249_AIPGENE26307 [Exaiptasia diaphana]|nr:hypothetical protein AC249_AIPGENE26307 [Exaiptasia diaphana]
MRKTSVKERNEGTTYKNAVGYQGPSSDVISAKVNKELRNSISDSEYKGIIDMGGVQEDASDSQSSIPDSNTESNTTKQFAYLVLDLETTGFEQTSEILQLCCMPISNSDGLLCKYMLPAIPIKLSASKVTGLTCGYHNGLHTFLFGTEFDAKEDVKALAEIMFNSDVQVDPNEFTKISKTMESVVEEVLRQSRTKVLIEEFKGIDVSRQVKGNLVQAGIK